MAAPSHILWQNRDASITIIDVPLSIAAAQQLHPNDIIDRQLLSTRPPLQQPFPSHGPKTAEKGGSILNHETNEKTHVEYCSILRSALTEIAQEYSGDWCHPRPSQGLSLNKRKRDEMVNQTSDELSAGELRSTSSALRTPVQLPLGVTNFGPLVTNRSDETVTISLKDREFLIPPRSSFFLSDCADSTAFHASLWEQSQEHDTPHQFDLLLLDPPWPNRSVKRARRTPGSTYATIRDLDSIYNLIMSMDLDTIMADDCLVGVWITNKPAVRELILGSDGIFATWGIKLIEEWPWLKTTVSGEAVAALDSPWRKPYEVLLIGGRRPSNVANPPSELDSIPSPRRRVIMGVPDIHSRKPCIKTLIEPMLSDAKRCRALELFARHLVAGWWSWGDECIKFNNSNFWTNHDH